MPFLSPDWRCPGDRWLRSSESGCLWENVKVYRMRMFERMSETAIKRICQRSLTSSTDENWDYFADMLKVSFYQPCVHLKTGAVREVSMTTTISEAFLGLDMKAAIRDVRRFNYVCRVVEILVTEYFHRLTGRLQLFLIELLRTILKQVQASCNQTALFKKILYGLLESLERNKYDHIGSAVLWQNHRKAVDDMLAELNDFDIGKKLETVANNRLLKARSFSGSRGKADYLNLEQLPPECLARVLTFVNSPQDLETASVASNTLASLVGEEHFWRNLTLANFDLDQMSSVHFGRPGWRDQPPATINDCNWRRAYLRLIKRYGDQHFYTAKLAVCDVCACLFWPLFGHPCRYPEKEARVRLLSPDEFIDLFEI